MLGGGNPALGKAYADGTLVGYGHDKNLGAARRTATRTTPGGRPYVNCGELLKALSAVSASDMPNSAARYDQRQQALGRGVGEPLLQLEARRVHGCIRSSVDAYKLKADAPDDSRIAMLSLSTWWCRCWRSCWPMGPFRSTRLMRRRFTPARRGCVLYLCLCGAEAGGDRRGAGGDPGLRKGTCAGTAGVWLHGGL